MKKIKVLYTIPNFDTAGSGKALLNLALGLNKELFEPHILCLHNRGAFFETVEKSGIPIHVFDYIPKERPILQMLKKCWKLSRKLKAIQPDIVHSFHYNSNYTEGLSTRLAGIKWVFTKKNMSWGGLSKNSWQLRSFLANKIALQNTDMKASFYPHSNKTSLISRGVDIEKFHFSTPDSHIKALMKTAENQRVLICVANFVPVKGIETLITAFDEIKAQHEDWVLWLVGDDKNEYGEKLHGMVDALGLNSKVMFSGKQMNVVDYLNHAEIFVLPTLDEGRREGSPVALLESMANSKVVLGSRVPGIRDQLRSFPEHLFTPKNEIELAKKLSFFMGKSRAELTELGKEFQNLVSQNYSIGIEIQKHEQFYLSLLKREI
ncbi:glycosyltransferase involved in cell wall biosynthesis [Flavobacterium arsenatis]|uniref:Glycosyltransferase involved in cell wall biosynthesis n=1 Tax=Flavobacterium arsenatis TaxID=1484332 RepID=A0ABU1TM01_9FLAO|nr:glycosyltransferase [Flavobacterium arsenatis]MDR6966994.1 glycosyltransferase involved in cell wall biosynthesis [Flavobacterium arsenatis]